MRYKSLLIAGLLLAGLVAWVASGHITDEPAVNAVATTPDGDQRVPALAVEVRELSASNVERTLVNQGQSEANRIVTVRNETAGTVERVLAPKGSRVTTGQPLIQLRMDDRDVRLADARALLAQREAEHTATRQLAAEGYQSQTALHQAAAALEKARAELRAVELDRERTTIRAPFDGVVNDRMVEVGDYVAVNTQLVQVVETDPLVVVVDIPQQDIRYLTLDQGATVQFVDGSARDGRVRFIAATADMSTRTFRVEVEVTNGEAPLPAGISAEVRIPVGSVAAHRLSPALLALDEDNALVVKTVDEAGLVAYVPVEVVRTERDGVWVSGLPATARVITAGQGFVNRGQPVTIAGDAAPPPAAIR